MATAKKAPAKAPAEKVTPAKKAPAAKRTPNAAFMKALTPSPALAAVVGTAPLPRTEIVSKLWIYIKKHDLQDKANKRNINADAKLKLIFGKDQVSMFELASLIGKHVS
jgi:chromatin remodeling complex protein RSC6